MQHLFEEPGTIRHATDTLQFFDNALLNSSYPC